MISLNRFFGCFLFVSSIGSCDPLGNFHHFCSTIHGVIPLLAVQLQFPGKKYHHGILCVFLIKRMKVNLVAKYILIGGVLFKIYHYLTYELNFSLVLGDFIVVNFSSRFNIPSLSNRKFFS